MSPPWRSSALAAVLGAALSGIPGGARGQCPGGEPAEIVRLPTIVSNFTQEAPRAFVLLEVKDASGRPVCRHPVECTTLDPGLVRFLEPVCFTNDEGVAANVLLRLVDDGVTSWSVRAGSVEAGPFQVRTFGWHIDGAPNGFRGEELAEFHGAKQVLRGTVGFFRDPLASGTPLRAWSIDPRVAEPLAGAIFSTGQFRQPVEIVVLGRQTGRTTLLIDTVDADILEIEVRGDLNPPFVRGDCDGTSAVDISDAIGMLEYLFARGEAPMLEEACNVDDMRAVEVTDAIRLLLHLFQGGPPPPAPFPDAGPDPTPP